MPHAGCHARLGDHDHYNVYPSYADWHLHSDGISRSRSRSLSHALSRALSIWYPIRVPQALAPGGKLSVIIPCLNEEATIIPTLEMLIARTSCLDLIAEVVVADSGSTDNTEVLSCFGRPALLPCPSPEATASAPTHA